MTEQEIQFEKGAHELLRVLVDDPVWNFAFGLNSPTRHEPVESENETQQGIQEDKLHQPKPGSQGELTSDYKHSNQVEEQDGATITSDDISQSLNLDSASKSDEDDDYWNDGDCEMYEDSEDGSPDDNEEYDDDYTAEYNNESDDDQYNEVDGEFIEDELFWNDDADSNIYYDQYPPEHEIQEIDDYNYSNENEHDNDDDEIMWNQVEPENFEVEQISNTSYAYNQPAFYAEWNANEEEQTADVDGSNHPMADDTYYNIADFYNENDFELLYFNQENQDTNVIVNGGTSSSQYHNGITIEEMAKYITESSVSTNTFNNSNYNER